MVPSVTPATSFMTKRLMPKGGVMEAMLSKNRDDDAEPDQIPAENLRNGHEDRHADEQQRHGRQETAEDAEGHDDGEQDQHGGDVQREGWPVPLGEFPVRPLDEQVARADFHQGVVLAHIALAEGVDALRAAAGDAVHAGAAPSCKASG